VQKIHWNLDLFASKKTESGFYGSRFCKQIFIIEQKICSWLWPRRMRTNWTHSRLNKPEDDKIMAQDHIYTVFATEKSILIWDFHVNFGKILVFPGWKLKKSDARTEKKQSLNKKHRQILFTLNFVPKKLMEIKKPRKWIKKGRFRHI